MLTKSNFVLERAVHRDRLLEGKVGREKMRVGVESCLVAVSFLLARRKARELSPGARSFLELF